MSSVLSRCLSSTHWWNCVFDTSGVRLVGEFVSDETGERLEERLDVKLEGEEHSDSLLFSLSQSSLMIIMLVADVISTSSELFSDDDLMLLLSSLETLKVSLFLLKRFLLFLPQGSLRGNGCGFDDFGWYG